MGLHEVPTLTSRMTAVPNMAGNLIERVRSPEIYQTSQKLDPS